MAAEKGPAVGAGPGAEQGCDEKGPLCSHEDLLLEALTQWLLVVLGAARAIPVGVRL